MSWKPLRVGIAGFGIVGKRRRDCINRNPKFQLAAVSDRNFEGIQVDDPGVPAHQDYRGLFSENLDGLIVCLPNDIAPEVTSEALKKGLHVFCEKPPGRNVSDVLKAISARDESPHLKLMYGFNHRYHESVQGALSIVRSGELGKIINLRGVYGKSKLVTFNQTDWRTRREVAGGGVLLDQGIHMVDLIRLFAGDFDEVHSFISNRYWGYDVEDNAYAIMRNRYGVIAMINSSATQWRHRFHLDINLEKGSLVLGGILSGSKSYGAETLTVVYADVDSDNGDPREIETRYNHDPSWDTELEEFATCILEDKSVTKSSPEDALETMKLVDRIYRADSVWAEKYQIMSG